MSITWRLHSSSAMTKASYMRNFLLVKLALACGAEPIHVCGGALWIQGQGKRNGDFQRVMTFLSLRDMLSIGNAFTLVRNQDGRQCLNWSNQIDEPGATPIRCFFFYYEWIFGLTTLYYFALRCNVLPCIACMFVWLTACQLFCWFSWWWWWWWWW